jgi:hypothetical protein
MTASGDDPGINNQKTPTVLLLSPDGEFHSFGFTARDFYHDMDARHTMPNKESALRVSSTFLIAFMSSSKTFY